MCGQGEVTERIEGGCGARSVGRGGAVEESADLDVGHGRYSKGGLFERVGEESVDS